MPILIIGVSIWTYVLGGTGAVAGLATTVFGGRWLGKKWTQRQKDQLHLAMVEAYRKQGVDGLKALFFEKKLAVTDDHADILVREYRPSVEAGAAAAVAFDALEAQKAGNASTAEIVETHTPPKGPPTKVTDPRKGHVTAIHEHKTAGSEG